MTGSPSHKWPWKTLQALQVADVFNVDRPEKCHAGFIVVVSECSFSSSTHQRLLVEICANWILHDVAKVSKPCYSPVVLYNPKDAQCLSFQKKTPRYSHHSLYNLPTYHTLFVKFHRETPVSTRNHTGSSDSPRRKKTSGNSGHTNWMLFVSNVASVSLACFTI